jgi:HlyD family secretion protein
MARWITIALAVLGLAVGIYAVATAKQRPPELPLAREASVNPFAHGVAALGLVEPLGRDVSIMAPEPALVAAVHVQVGEAVKAGQPLFELDTRGLQADLIRAQAAVAAGQAEVERWHALPRAEDLPPLQASIERAAAVVKDREEQMRLTEEAVRRSAANARDLSLAQYALDAARADLERAQADLARLKAGGWGPDLAVAQASLARFQSEVQALRLLVERMTVKSPRDAVVLRRSVEPGEFATTDPARPAMIIGDLSRLTVRAQVDEEDIALVGAQPRALARTRGAVPEQLPLRLLRIEPYARPKTDLIGTNVERVDTRVIDVVFEVTQPPKTSVYPGQAVDVFIESSGRP